MVTFVMAATLIAFAGPAARYYDAPNLDRYLQVTALCFFVGSFSYPIIALMSREMAFGTLALISVMTTLLNGAAAVVLAIFGQSYMSFAWANFISAMAGMFLCYQFRPDLSIFRPSLSDWRGVLAFGVYDSATAMLSQISDSVSYLIIGRVLNAGAVGLCRTYNDCAPISREGYCCECWGNIAACILESCTPGSRFEGQLSQRNRTYYRRPMAEPDSPALAHPIVSMLLGRQWLGAVPLVQTVAGALLFYFPIGLTYPIIVAARGVRHMPWLVLVQGIVSISVLSIAVRYGLQAIASSTFLTVPFNVFLSVLLVRFHVLFRWGDSLPLMRKFTVSVLFATGPFVIVIGCGWRVDLSMSSAILAVILSAIGWIGGLWLTRASPFERVALRSKCRAWQPDHCESPRCGAGGYSGAVSFVRKNMIVKVRLSIAYRAAVHHISSPPLTIPANIINPILQWLNQSI